MELRDLVGPRLLSAVDFTRENDHLEEYCAAQDSQVVRFRLGGVVYQVHEDPADGYRSCASEITIVPDAKMSNTFAPVRVIGIHCSDGEYGSSADVLELRSMHGDLILKIGTGDVDDYYPYFIGSFFPNAIVT